MSRNEEFHAARRVDVAGLDSLHPDYLQALGFSAHDDVAATPLQYDDSVFNRIDASDRYRPEAHTVTEDIIPASHLYATQEWVDRGVVEYKATSPEPEPIEVVRWRGRNFVMDGHHRAASAALLGVPVRARVYHLTDDAE